MDHVCTVFCALIEMPSAKEVYASAERLFTREITFVVSRTVSQQTRGVEPMLS